MAVYTMTFQEFFDAGFMIGNYPIWDETYRNVLNDKIKNHYLYKEIGQETPGRFKHYLDTKLNEIMPYYNQLYQTTLQEYDISVVSETTETYNANAQTDSESSSTASSEQSGSVENSSSSSSEASGTGTATNTTTYDNTTTNTNEGVYSLTDNRESETPEGALTLTDDGQLSSGYLTRASTNRTEQGGASESKHTGTDTTANNTASNSEVNASSENTSSSTTSGSSEASQTAKINNTSDYLKNVTVKNPNLAVSTIAKLRKNIINIDMMIIEELGELFMMVY